MLKDECYSSLSNLDQQWKKATFSQYKIEGSENFMGYSIRVNLFRFTEWYWFNLTTATPNFTDIYGTELCDHTAPTTFFNDENVNLASESEMQSFVKSFQQI